MSDEAYKYLTKALEESNKKNDDVFKGFESKLIETFNLANDIDLELKNVKKILVGDPNIPTQLGLAKTVYNNQNYIQEIKSYNIKERLRVLESQDKKYQTIITKAVGASGVILAILAFILRYEKNLM